MRTGSWWKLGGWEGVVVEVEEEDDEDGSDGDVKFGNIVPSSVDRR